MTARWMVVSILAACGGGGGGTDGPPPIDASHTVDSPMIDATPVADGAPDGAPDGATDAPPADAPPDGSPVDTGAFVISRMLVPTSTAEVQTYGQDIDADEPDGDIGVDNQLGSVMAALASMGFDPQATTTAAVDTGSSIGLFYLDPTAVLHTYIGANPVPPACNGPGDTICRHHLDGTGAFDIPPDAPTGMMPTTTVGSITTGGPGTSVIQLPLFGGTEPVTLSLIGARFTGTVTATGIVNAKLAGAVPATDINTVVIPALAASLAVTIAADCTGSPPPGCGCDPGSTGQTLLATFDANDDCVVTATELQDDPLIAAFFQPDVTIDGHDGVSLGVALEAATATFTP